jgi:hypothetical protein
MDRCKRRCSGRGKIDVAVEISGRFIGLSTDSIRHKPARLPPFLVNAAVLDH